MTGHDLYILSPHLAMAGLAGLLVILDLIVREKRIVSTVAFVGLAAPATLSLMLWFDPPDDTTAIFGALVADKFALFFQFLLVGVAALIVLASVRYEQRFEGIRGEYVALMFFSVTGMMLLASGRELISLYVALELTSLPAAALVAFLRDTRSTESGLKFLLLSAISSAVLLYGLVYIYGFTGTTYLDEILNRIANLQTQGALDPSIPFGSYALLVGIVLTVTGFAFKLSAVPSQMWVPDVYEGAPTPVTAFLSVASKAAGFAVVLRILYAGFASPALSLEWSALFAILAVVSMTVGNLLALNQRNIKRMLAYSTIAHAGYIMVGIAAAASRAEGGNILAGPQSVLFYLIGYGFTNLATFFAVIAITNRTGNDLISGFAGMGKRTPRLALLLTLGLLSLLGMPPTVGFMAKAFVFSTAVNADLLWLALAGMMNSAVSAFYYLRVVRTMYLDQPEDESRVSADIPITLATGVTAAGIAVFGFAPWFLLRLAEIAVQGLSVG